MNIDALEVQTGAKANMNDSGRNDTASSTSDYVIVLVSRLSSLLDKEKRALLQFNHKELDEILSEKVRLLRDFSKLQDAGSPVAREGDDLTGIIVQNARTKLEENREALGMHVRAIGQVVNTISAAVENAKSDGTYQRI